MPVATISRAPFVRSLLALGVLLALSLAVGPARGQVVIEERVEVKPTEADSLSAVETRAMAAAETGAGSFTASKSGRLKMHYVRAERYAELLAPDAKLHVSKPVEDFRSDVVVGRFAEPLQLRNGGDPNPWYYYGEGPFTWEASSAPADVQDARVFSLNCGARWAEERHPWCRTTNFGGGPTLKAMAWTYYGDPAVNRSFLRFNLSSFSGSSVAAERALLRLHPYRGRQSQLSGSNAFVVSSVAHAWNEGAVTWNTQPGVSGPSVTAPGGSGTYEVDVTSIVQGWLAGGANRGFRLALANESYYRQQSFGSSDAPASVRPELEVDIRNPDGVSDHAVFDAGPVQQDDEVTLYYGEDPLSISTLGPIATTMTVDGEEHQGQFFTFLKGSAPLTDYSERLDVFVFVEEQPLKIEIPGSKEVWPAVSEGEAYPTYDFDAVERTLDGITVSVREGGEPVATQDVEITTSWVEDSGGHKHEGTICRSSGPALSTPPRSEKGFLEANGTKNRGEIDVVTDGQGKAQLQYEAPEYSGKVALRAETVLNGETYTAHDTLAVRVPDLVPLPRGNNYEKVGGTSAHTGPRLDGRYPGHHTPDNNHYGTQALVNSITAIADEWKAMSDRGDIREGQIPLNINDMSSPKGGIFDVCGRWTNPHTYHRVGLDVDVRTTRTLPYPGERTGVYLRPTVVNGVTEYKNTFFEELAKKKGANPRAEIHSAGTGNEHYHIYFYSEN